MAAIDNCAGQKSTASSLSHWPLPDDSAATDTPLRPTTAVTIIPSVNELRSRIAATIEMEAHHGSRMARHSRHSSAIGERGHSHPRLPRSQSSLSLNEAEVKQTARARADSHIEDVHDRRPRTPNARYSLYPSPDHRVSALSRSVGLSSSDASTPSIRSKSSVPAVRSPLSNVALKPDEDPLNSPLKSSHSTSSSQRLSASSWRPLQAIPKSEKPVKRFRLPLSRILGKIPEPMSETSSYESNEGSEPAEKPESSIPAWRYEDYGEQPQSAVPSRKHKRSLSSIFRNRRSVY